MKTLLFLLLLTTARAQDSTFSHWEPQVIVDSVIFAGDTKKFEIYEDFHVRIIGYYQYKHNWIDKGNERICLGCSLWQKFHTEKVKVYQYDIFYIAKQKALKLIERKRNDIQN